MDRRHRGLGGVYQRRDGRWEGRIRIRGGPRRSFYARTRRDVVRRLSEARWALGQGLAVSARTTSLRVYLQHWLLVCRTRLRPMTLVTYSRDVRRLTVVFGEVPLRQLTPGLIQSAYASLLEDGFSKRSVEQTHAVLHRALDQAMHWGLTTRNAAELVSPPRSVRREMTALSGDQLQQLLQVTIGSQWNPLWVLLGTSGLRLGEALGLHWQDIDLAGRRLAVRCALQRQRGRGLVLVPPKTPRSRRTIYLSELAQSALKEQRQRQWDRRSSAKRWTDSGLAFTNRTGGGLEQGVVGRALVQALADAGLPRVRVHDLRHTTASVLLAAGTHPKVVQDLLGHSTITLTLDTYSHLTQPLHEQAARTMDAVLSMDLDKPAVSGTAPARHPR
jgi:site-specific recombinase XerD